MNIKLIGALIDFEIEGDYSSYKIPGSLRISKNQKILSEKFLNDTFVKNIGEIEARNLREFMYVYLEVNKEEDPQKFHTLNIPGQLLNSVGILKWWLFSLWLVKDNSVKIRNTYLYTEDVEIITIYSNTAVEQHSNAIGQHCNTRFTLEEFEKSIYWFSVFLPHVIQDEKREVVEDGFQKDDTPKIYVKNDRFLRALRFISVARGQAFIPEKITSFVSAMEALLSTSNAELRFQVSERACKILGGDLEEKKKNYALVKEAYDARSAYVHGAELFTKYRKANGKLENLAVSIDNLMRELLKVLLEKYSDIATMESKQLNDWFEDLILK
ncbi:hypothetical protein [Bacillus wiedmannii]|uniref:hypothetical protein n=1 Tax=Bacillus wiedmannii TaxID=1890302 RepID=UPI003D9583F4